MEWHTQRGIAQVVIGLCCLCFALSMAVRSYREHGLVWPLRWRMLVAVWIGVMGGSFLEHSLHWLTNGAASPRQAWLIWPLWLLAGLTAWVFARWLRDDPVDGER